MRKKLGITKKFLLVYLIISVPLVLIIAVTYRGWYNTRVETVLLERTAIARSVDASFTLLITEIGRSMKHMGREIFANEYPASQVSIVLSQLIADYPVSCAVITTPDALVTNSTDVRLVGTSLKQDKAFRQVIDERKEIGIGNSLRTLNGVGFYVTHAVRSRDGKLLGIMGSFVSVDKLYNMFPISSSRASINIVDAEGYVIYQNEFPELAQQRSYWGNYDFIKSALNGKEVTGRFTFPPTGALRLVSEVPINKFGWATGSGIDYADSVNSIAASTVNAALIAALTLIVAAAIGFFIIRGIIESLFMLVNGSRAIGEGRLDEPIVLHTGDEIESLAESLDDARISLKSAVEDVNAISQITDVAISTIDIDQLLQHLLERLVSIASADAAVIFFNEGNKLTARSSIGLEEEVLEDFSVPVGVGFVGTVAKTMQMQYIEDAQNNPKAVNPIIVKRGIRSMLGTPLVVGDTLVGVLHIDWLSIHARDSREVHLFELVVDRIALAISNAQLHERTEEELSRTKLLQGVATAAASSPDINKVAKEILRELFDHAGLRAGVVYILDEDKGILRVLSSFGISDNNLTLPLTDDNYFAVRALKSKKIMAHNENKTVFDKDEFVCKAVFEGSRYVALPFEYRDKVLGVMSLSFEGCRDFTSDEFELFRSIASITGQAFENARLFGIERNIADTLQEALLTIPSKIRGIEFGYFYRSAAEAAQVGGDFYDLFELDYGKIGIVIGDVSGKGIEAATLTSTVKNAIKAFSYEYLAPNDIIARTNDLVARSTSANIFVTVFLGIFNIATGELSYCTAGHPPAIVKRGLSVELLQAQSPIIGAFQGIDFSADSTVLGTGDVLILYTDGVIEARRDGDFYGEDRLVEFIKKLRYFSPKGLPKKIFDDVLEFSNGVTTDDIALLAVSPVTITDHRLT